MRPRTDALAAIHETMTALHQAGVIDDQIMRSFDEVCLLPSPSPASDHFELSAANITPTSSDSLNMKTE